MQIAAIILANRASLQARAAADHANTDGHRDSAQCGVLERQSCTMCVFLHDVHIPRDPDMAHMTCNHQFPGISLEYCLLVSTVVFNAPHAVAAASAWRAERSKIASCTGLGGYSATVGSHHCEQRIIIPRTRQSRRQSQRRIPQTLPLREYPLRTYTTIDLQERTPFKRLNSLHRQNLNLLLGAGGVANMHIGIRIR